jgi:hypothetical protein
MLTTEESVFYVSVSRLYSEASIVAPVLTRVVAGSNTSTVTLRVVGGDEKGRLESETVKYGHEFYGTRTRKLLRWRGPAAIVNDILVLSSERAPQITNPATVRQ